MFTSSQLNHGVASLRFDEGAFLYGLVRGLGSRANRGDRTLPLMEHVHHRGGDGPRLGA